MADDKKVITVNLSMFGQDAAAKTAAANKVAKELGISDGPRLRSRTSSSSSPCMTHRICRSWAT